MGDAWYILLGIIGSFSFGLTAVILSYGVKNQNIFAGINIRILASLPFLLVLSVLAVGIDFTQIYIKSENLVLIISISVLLISGDLLLMSVLKTKSVGIIAPLVAVTPLFTVILLLLTGEANITTKILILTIFIVIGIGMVTFNPEINESNFDLTALKYGITIALLWGFMLYFEVKLLNKPETDGISFATMKFLILGIIGLMLYLINERMNFKTPRIENSENNLKFLLLAGFVGWVLGSVLVYTALSNGPVEIITPIIGLNPFFSVLISLSLGRESFSTLKGVGVVLCVISSIFLIY